MEKHRHIWLKVRNDLGTIIEERKIPGAFGMREDNQSTRVKNFIVSSGISDDPKDQSNMSIMICKDESCTTQVVPEGSMSTFQKLAEENNSTSLFRAELAAEEDSKLTKNIDIESAYEVNDCLYIKSTGGSYHQYFKRHTFPYAGKIRGPDKRFIITDPCELESRTTTPPTEVGKPRKGILTSLIDVSLSTLARYFGTGPKPSMETEEAVMACGPVQSLPMLEVEPRIIDLEQREMFDMMDIPTPFFKCENSFKSTVEFHKNGNLTLNWFTNTQLFYMEPVMVDEEMWCAGFYCRECIDHSLGDEADQVSLKEILADRIQKHIRMR